MSLADRELTQHVDDRILCIYHGHCDDGFAAAWAVRHALGDECVEFHAGVYGQAPPDVTDRRVLLVDFSYKRPVLETMAAVADGVLILDHHKTAEADLLGMYQPTSFEEWFKRPRGIRNFDSKIPGLEVVFDMDRSGAGLTWDYLHPGQPRPRFIDYVEDRDLWRKQLLGVDEFTMALRSYPQTFDAWDILVGLHHEDQIELRQEYDACSVKNLVDQGTAILRYYRQQIEALKKTAYLAYFPGRFGDHLNPLVAVVNAPYCFASELAGEVIDLFPGVQFGVCYFEERAGEYKYSLRSRDDKMDCSLVASKLGGGGHRNAAGFEARRVVHERM